MKLVLDNFRNTRQCQGRTKKWQFMILLHMEKYFVGRNKRQHGNEKRAEMKGWEKIETCGTETSLNKD